MSLPILTKNKLQEIKVGRHAQCVSMSMQNDLMLNHQLTSIEKEDRETDEGREIESTIQLSEISPDHGAQDEAHTGGCIELSQYKWPFLLCNQIRKQSPGDGEGVLKNTCKRTRNMLCNFFQTKRSPLWS